MFRLNFACVLYTNRLLLRQSFYFSSNMLCKWLFKRQVILLNKRLKIRSFTILMLCIGLYPASFSLAKSISSDMNTSIQNRILASFTGDLDALRERRLIRVLVSHTKTNFFITPKGFRGIEYDLLKAYESFLNRGPRRQRYQTHLTFIPQPFSQVLSKLEQGFGDIAASGLTITPERESLVDFTDPYITNIDEILVSNTQAETIIDIEDLSGKQVIVVANSSYMIHLAIINQFLGKKGLEPIEIFRANPLLEAEDLLELVNEKIYDYTFIDSHLAYIWKKVLKNIQIQSEIVLHKNSNISWAIQKKLPKLKASLNKFIKLHARPGKLLSNSVYKKYFKNPFWIKKPLTHDLLEKVNSLQYYLEYYGQFYDINWQLLAALAYQESNFNHNKKSHAGAIGIMQIKESTARDKHVNIQRIDKLENNVHAGIKYLSFLKEHYFSSITYSQEEQINFALAAYNAGPARIKKLQKIARKRGLNPYKWFYNVETIAREKIGHETVNYVTSIQKMKLFLNASTKLYQEKRLYLERTQKHSKS